MEWRQQTGLSCADAFNEARRWIEEVTGKPFGCSDFRAALENGVLLCDLINQLKPGIIKRVNRLSTPIAGLDNVNVFLKACGKLGLNESQLFHPGDLQDLSSRVTLRRDESTRRLRNMDIFPAPPHLVLITVYWLARKANLDAFYTGPALNFKAFEGLLGLTSSKALDEGGNVFVKDGTYRDCRYPGREEFQRMRLSYKRGDSVDSLESLDKQALHPNNEGCGSDAEAEQVFRMETTQQTKGYVPASQQKRHGRGESGRVCSSPFARYRNAPFKSTALGQYNYDYTDADPVTDDLKCQIQVRPERRVQVNPGWIWSKSLSDIPMVYPIRKISDGNTRFDMGQDTSTSKPWHQENKWKCQDVVKDSEAHWQDDLTKWKNRRRSTKSDPRRKSQDREHVINQMTNGAMTDYEKNEAQGEEIKRDQLSPRKHNHAPQCCPTSLSKLSSAYLRPHTRGLLARSYATEIPLSYTQEPSVGSMPVSDGNISGEETHFASLASNGAAATTPSLDFPFSSQTQVKAQGGSVPCKPANKLAQPETVYKDQISSLFTTISPIETKSTGTRGTYAAESSHEEPPLCMETNVPSLCTDAGNLTAVDALVDFSHQKRKFERENQKTTWEPAMEQSGGQQAVGTYKYLSRTGSLSCSASLPRGYRRSEGPCRLSSVITARPFRTKPSRVSSLPRLYNVDDNEGLSSTSEREGSHPPPTSSFLKRQTATAHLSSQYQAPVKQKQANNAKQTGSEQQQEEDGKCPNLSGPTYQTNGCHSQPYNQAQLLPQPSSSLQPQIYKPSTLPSTASIDLPKVDHRDMRVSLTLKPNSRPDFGFQTEGDSTGARIKFIQPGSPAELCQLCIDDEVVAIDGVPVAHMSSSQWEDRITSALQTGSLTMDIRRYRNKDWSTIEGHNNQPGQSRMTLNLTAAAPVLIGCSGRHANGPASTKTAATNFSGKTDNVIQVKVMDGELVDNHGPTISKEYISRKNQMREEFFKQKGGSESAISDLQVPSLSPSSSSWSWDHEEDRRRQEKWQEEQGRLLQEQYQRDQQRLEAEWQRAQRDSIVEENTCEMTNGGESLHVNGLTNKAREEEQSPDMEEHLKALSKPQSCTQMVQNKITEQDWAKSLSTPALAGISNQPRGDQRKKKGESVSKAEQERQQILEEMKKRTQLLTDNSWIRQRSSSFYKEPIYVGVPLKRYESLDNLDSLRQSLPSNATFSHPRPHSAAGGYGAPSRNSSSRYSTGGVSSQRNAAMNPHHSRIVSGRRTCSVCERVLGVGAAMVIEALSLYFHFTCFQCVGCHRHLGRAETEVQVRIRNGKPHCKLCYFQPKYTGAPSL